MTTIRKGSNEYKQNLSKQQFLKDNGINVKLDGSWGPWQQEQYSRLKSINKQNWFTRSMIGTAMADQPAVMTASGWTRNKDGNWIQTRNKDTNQLADNLASISEAGWTAPTLVGDIKALYGIVRHPVQSAKTAYNLGKDTFTVLKDPKFIKFPNQAGGIGTTDISSNAVSGINPLKLHVSRLTNGGIEKLKQRGGQIYTNAVQLHVPQSLVNDPKITQFLQIDNIKIVPNNTIGFVNAGIEHGGAFGGFPGGNLEGIIGIYPPELSLNRIFSSKYPMVISHELDHVVQIPNKPAEGFNNLSNYFTHQNNTELSARGSQIKDYLGFIKADQEITSEQLKYAAEHYVNDTGFDNNMTEFFNSIVDWKKAAKWLSETSTMITTPIILNNKR